MTKLIIQTGKLVGKQLTIPVKSVLIGRDEGCYIRMGSPDISRRHCSLSATVDGILVEDLGSSNGTYVNQVRISTPTILKPGDQLRVGPAEFVVAGLKKSMPQLDDSVMDWLNDGDSKTGLATDGDTAIHQLPGRSTEPQSPSPAVSSTLPSPTLQPPTLPPQRTKRVFKTVAEEAQYVIALYHDQQRQRALGESSVS